MIPMCNDKHWTLMHVKVGQGEEENKMVLYDSLGPRDVPRANPTSPVYTFSRLVATVLNRVGMRDRQARLRGEWPLERGVMQVQVDGWSCGYHMLVMMDMLAQGYTERMCLQMYSARKDMKTIRQYYGRWLLMTNVVSQGSN